MRKIILIVSILMFSIHVNAQELLKYRFFSSYKDYKENKPVQDINIVQYNGSVAQINDHGTVTKNVSPKNFPSAWYTNATGFPMRVFDEHPYYILAEGKLCYYLKESEGRILHPDTSFIDIKTQQGQLTPMEYYSETINGEIKRLKNSILEDYLDKAGLKEQFANEKVKRELDCADCTHSNLVNKMIKYVKLINEKLK